MIIWIGIATAWVACLAVMAALVARTPIMDETRIWRNERNGLLRGKRG